MDYKHVWKIKMRENKIILGDFNCTMDKIDSDDENKTQRLHRCCFNYALSKLIVDNELEDLRRRENPDWQKSVIDRVCTDMKIANNTKINHIMVSFTDHQNAISIDRLPSKTKTGEDSWYFNNSFSYKPEFFSATKTLLFLLKTQKTTTI